MIRSKLLFCAEAIIRDEETKVASAFNIIQDFNAESLPAVVPRFAIYSYLEREASDSDIIECKFTINLNEEALFSHNFEVNFLDKLNNQTIIKLNNLVINKPGLLEVSIIFKDEVLAHYSITVNQRGLVYLTGQNSDNDVPKIAQPKAKKTRAKTKQTVAS